MSEFLSEISFFLARLDWTSVVDILLVTAVIFLLLQLVRGTQAMVLLRGIILLIVLVAVLTSFFKLRAFSWLLSNTLPALLIAIPVIFAPEIRRALERLGRASAWVGLTGLTGLRDASDPLPIIQAIATGAQRLAERQRGGLIIIEREVGLKNYVDTGVTLDASVTVELLLQIFYPNSPLHDGAVIIQGSRLLAAACVLPLSTSEGLPDRKMGLRHRAALGISESSDAVAVVVSEETGIISLAHNGRMIQRLDAARLRHILLAFYRLRTDNWLTRLKPLFGRRGPEKPAPAEEGDD